MRSIHFRIDMSCVQTCVRKSTEEHNLIVTWLEVSFPDPTSEVPDEYAMSLLMISDFVLVWDLF